MRNDNLKIDNDEISLKELILSLIEFYKEIIKHWKWLVTIPIPLIGYMLYKTYTLPTTFEAELTFMMNDDKGSGGGLSGLAASFGLGGVKGEYNLEKMHSLLKSRKIIEKVLFEKIQLLGKVDFIGNHIIREYKFHERWEEDNSSLMGFLFNDDNLDKFKRKENTVLKSIYNLITRGGILSSNINDETRIMSISVNSTNEEFSIILVERLFKRLSQFYIIKSVEQQQQTFALAKSKADSLKSVLNTSQIRLLRLKDSHRNLTLLQYQAEQMRIEYELQALVMAYGESLRNQEIADFSLKSNTPFIQPIDFPISPLEKSKGLIDYIKAIILGLILGIFITVTFIVSRKIIRNSFDEDE